MKGDQEGLFSSGKIIIIIILSIFMLCLIVGCRSTSLSNYPSTFQGSIEIKAIAELPDGIEPTKGFLLSSTEALSEDLLRQTLRLSPDFEYDLKKDKGSKSYQIIPKETLSEQTLYKIGFDPQNALSGLEPRSNYQWAFQTVGGFAVRSILPRDTATGVPITAGIEVSFNQKPSLESLNKYTNIEPALSGEWTLRNNTAVFIPDKPLSYAQVYRIIIGNQVSNQDKTSSLGIDIQILFETTATEVEDNNRVYFEIAGQNKAFRPTQRPYFLYYQNKNSTAKAEVTIYQYPNQGAYLDALQLQTDGYEWSFATREKVLPINGLDVNAQFSISGERYNGFWYFFFPEDLDTGFYLAEFNVEGIKRQSLFQVTELSAYLACNELEALVWVNDLRNGQPVAEGVIQVAGTKIQALTDETGSAVLRLEPKASGENIFVIKHQNHVLIMNSGKGRYNYQQSEVPWIQQQIKRQAYWNYLYADRPLYRPGDTVYLFGLLAPRDKDYPEIKEVTIKLNSASSQFNNPEVITLPVEEGVIKGEFQLPILAPGYYYLSMHADDNYYSSAYFQVQLYEKPAYQLTMTTDKKAVMAGDKVTWTTEAAFFEGSPLPQLAVSFRGDLIQRERKVLTDQKGQIRFTTDTEVVDTSTLYSGQWIHAYTTLPETGDIERWQSIYVFNSDIELKGKIKRNNHVVNYKVTGYSVDPSKIQDWSSQIEEQAYSPLSATLQLKATLKRHEWDKTLRDYTYDPYTKQNKPNYDYSLRQEVENIFDWSLTGDSEHNFEFTLNQENGYTLMIEGKDQGGRNFTRSYYIPASSQDYGRDMGVPYYWLSTDQQGNTVDFGEEITLRIYNDEVPISVGEGYFLFYRSKEQLLDYTLTKENEYTFAFQEEFLPNLNIMAVGFDGSSYYCVNYPYTVQMNLSERQAKVHIAMDQSTYKPGEVVKLNLQLTDGSGKPMAGYINLNLIDEALLAISNQYVDMAQSIFWANMYPFTLKYSTSHVKLFMESMAEGGGEGDGFRTEFRDTALFETIKTDARGRGKLEFTLPDNITAWRLIWQAYVPDIWVGSGTKRIDVSLPFFADIRIGDNILAGDAVVLGLRGAGSALNSSTDNLIEWSVEIPEVGYKKTLKGQGYVWSELLLPTLPPDDYTLKVTARYQDLEDALQRSFKVVDSLQSHEKLKAGTLKTGFKPLGASKGLTTLSFSDLQRNQALQGLSQLASQDNVRLEQRLASVIARKFLADKFNWQAWAASESEVQQMKEQVLGYQQYNGGIAILPYSEASLEVSVLAASCGEDYFDQTALRAYFNSVLESDAADLQERSLALWGCAALGQPVLKEIDGLLIAKETGDESLPGEVRLNLLLAKTFAGDGAKTKDLAQDFVNRWTEDLQTARRASIGDTEEAMLKATARLAMLSQLLDLPEAEGLYQYVLDQQSATDYYLLEQLIILEARLQQLPTQASFSYTLFGKTETVDLLQRPVYTLTLTPKQLAEIQFQDIKGDIKVLTSYQAIGLPEGKTLQEGLWLERSYKVAGQATTSLPIQGKIEVSIDYRIPEDAPAGWYQIVDCLPAGLRFVSMAEISADVIEHPWLLQENGNQLVFGLVKNQKEVRGTLSYYVRVAMPGTYRGEAPYMTHSRLANIFVLGNESKLHIH